MRTRIERGGGPSVPHCGMASSLSQTGTQADGGKPLGVGPRLVAGELSRHRATRQQTAPPPLASSRTRGSKHLNVIRARLRLSPPISPVRWTCSPPLRARSMSRFPAVAGRAPRRQEEGEQSRDPQEERPSGVSIADRGAIRGTPRRLARVMARGFRGIKVCLGQIEKSGKEAAAFSLPSKPEANFASNEHFGLEGGGPRPKLGENPAGGQKSEPQLLDALCY